MEQLIGFDLKPRYAVISLDNLICPSLIPFEHLEKEFWLLEKIQDIAPYMVGREGLGVGVTCVSPVFYEGSCTMLDALLSRRPEPPEVSEKWRLLGYEIADRFFISGLLNCGDDVFGKAQEIGG